jgi:16S rRNA (cytosine967-C5)-methyltransferase
MPKPAAPSIPANPRSLCLRALLEWEKGRSFSDEILHDLAENSRIAPGERALLTELFYGILRNLRALDFRIDALRRGPLDPQTQALLRLGLYQLFHTRIPEHAAVFETVSLASRSGALVNAVLRRAARERSSLDAALLRAPLPVQLSQPDFLWNRWLQQFGEPDARRLAEWYNTPAETFFRANTLKTHRDTLLAQNPDAEPWPHHPELLRIRRIPPDWIAQGLGYAQDPSTLNAPDLLDPQPGERILDACAAPGGKTTAIAARMRNEGCVVACELFESRTKRLLENVTRLGASIVQIHTLDFLMLPEPGSPLIEAPFDRILLDVPCSNTGVLRRRVDVRWRLTEEDFIRMPVQQAALVRRALPLLKPGGTLVYSTCSLEPEENELLVAQLLQAHPELALKETRQTLPFRDGIDGAFAARFQLRNA